MHSRFREHLDAMDRALIGLPADERREMRDEAAQHLAALADEERSRGATEEAAVAAAVSRFGDVAGVGRGVAREARRGRVRRLLRRAGPDIATVYMGAALPVGAALLTGAPGSLLPLYAALGLLAAVSLRRGDSGRLAGGAALAAAACVVIAPLALGALSGAQSVGVWLRLGNLPPEVTGPGAWRWAFYGIPAPGDDLATLPARFAAILGPLAAGAWLGGARRRVGGGVAVAAVTGAYALCAAYTNFAVPYLAGRADLLTDPDTLRWRWSVLAAWATLGALVGLGVALLRWAAESLAPVVRRIGDATAAYSSSAPADRPRRA